MKLKGRVLVHGSIYSYRYIVRAQCEASDMTVIRILLSIVTSLGFPFGSSHIKGTYWQYGPITRKVYVRPQRNFNVKNGELCRLLTHTFGLVDSGRQWSMKIEGWRYKESKLEQIFGVPQLLMKESGNRIDLLVAKVRDDFLVSGSKYII